MNRTLAVCMALTLTLICAGCGSSAVRTEQTAVVTEASSPIDIDMLHMSSTMIYSEVSQIVSEPTNYIGKTIRAKGTFRENNGYYFIIINDATACCAQGIEFIWKGEHQFPQDYPDADAEIVVTGTFRNYFEGDQQYFHIDDAALETV